MSVRLYLLIILCSSTAFAQKHVTEGVQDVIVPFAIVETPPAYPGCDLSDTRDSKACTSKRIQHFFERNFDLQKIKSLGLKPGRYRTSMIFKINTEGKITNIKANNYQKVKEIEEEAVRVAQLLPEMKPGERKGEIVSVHYGLPIVFEIEPEKRKRKNKG